MIKAGNIIHLFITLFCLPFLTGCGPSRLTHADRQFENGEYFEAAANYKKIYNKLKNKTDRKQKGEIAFRMGKCYEKINMYPSATVSFQNAIKNGVNDSSIILSIAKSQHAEKKYKEALENYRRYLEIAPGSVEAKNGIQGTLTALEAKNKPTTRYIVRQMKIFNSTKADFSPVFAGNDFDRIYFTSTNQRSTGTARNSITGMKNSDIWTSRKNDDGKWMRPEVAEGDLNTDADEGIISFSPDGQTMYLTKSKKENGKDTAAGIYKSHRTEARWGAPVRMEITTDTLSNFGHPAVSPDGEWLYFISDMPGGFGGKDIWRINLSGRGSLPENLGQQINTSDDEMFPYLRNDSTLYFSSKGHPGFGGLDIFKAVFNSSQGKWEVENVGTPLNSSSDDFGITFGPGETGFFSSNRGDLRRGYDHIYSFELPQMNIFISGQTIDTEGEPIGGAVIRIIGDDGTNHKEITNPDGTFKFRINPGTSYAMLAGAREHLNARQEFTSDNSEDDAEYYVEFTLAPVNRPVVVENIFYDYDKATLRRESEIELDKIAQTLRDNPNVTIEMASHTDRHGSEDYNIGLSQRRAASVIDYLIKVGISPDRLQAQGYGKSRPKTITRHLAKVYPQFTEGTVLTPEFIETLPDEDKEIADQINRRTEFQVLTTDYNMF